MQADEDVDSDVSRILDHALATIRRNAAKMGASPPILGRPDLTYMRQAQGAWSWVAGFWSGQLWLAYAETDDPFFLEAARKQRAYFAALLERPAAHTHDLGFLFTLSAVADHKLTGDPEARRLALTAGESLASRYNSTGRFVRAWNEWPDQDNEGKIIIDCLENLPLLYWCAQETGDGRYREIATQHASTSAKHLVRPDGSTYHTFDFDPQTGTPLGGSTHQGHSDESCWSRGQGWGIHGFALAHEHTGLTEFLEASRRLADYAIARLPDDGVPYWDYVLPEQAPRHRDTSAAAITAAGLLLLADQLGDDPLAAGYRDVAHFMVKSLSEHYSTAAWTQAEGLLLQGASHVPKGEVDVMLPYGDYYYLEALARARGRREFFW